MAKIGFISLGCAKNQVDCERMMYRVQEAGHSVEYELPGCDVVVINTCGFIDSAKSEAIDAILAVAQLKAQARGGKRLVPGCRSRRSQAPVGLAAPAGDGLLGTGSYTEIVPAIESLLEEKTVVSYGSIDTPEAETGRILTTPAHYAFVKIAEGCDNRCAYCIIPYLRGRYRSRQMEDIVAEAESLAENGVKELIVVAQDTSRYGTDLPGHKRLLPALLRRRCRIDGLHWIRVHYVYPDEIDDELISVIAEEPKIVKYLDIPIQRLLSLRRRGPRHPEWSMCTRTPPPSGCGSLRSFSPASWMITMLPGWIRIWRSWWTAMTRKRSSSMAEPMPTLRILTDGSGWLLTNPCVREAL